MVILSQGCQEVVDVEILFVYGDRTLCHFSTVIIAHKLIERVEAWNYVLILVHLVKKHRQRRTQFTALGLGHPVVL